jgi:hypothetical protein
MSSYILQVDLDPTLITNPSITRTLSIPCNSTFKTLHLALQIAFGWASIHNYHFTIEPTAWGIDVTLRIIDEGGTADLMNMMNPGESRDPEKHADRTMLWEIFDEPEYQAPDQICVYEYDLRDCMWDHLITVRGKEQTRMENENGIVCLEGVGHPAAEAGQAARQNFLVKAYKAVKPDE